VQISDDNLHRVRALMDEVFGSDNFISQITFWKTSGASSPQGRTDVLATTCDYLLWYARDREQLKYRQLYALKDVGRSVDAAYSWVELASGERRPVSEEERSGEVPLPN